MLFSNQGSESTEQKANPFDVPVDVVINGLESIAKDFHLSAVINLLEKDIKDLEELRRQLDDLEDRSLSKRMLMEVDIIVDDYRRSVCLF